MKINYKIELETPALTGQSGVIGKDIDIVTKKDGNGLPYFPATHIKGILRDRCEYMEEISENFSINEYFGIEGEDKTRLIFSNLFLDGIKG
jgi:CRISPR/Cas system CSM-associated protein Csm3 (group 7 of RAMP superfamily)